MKIAPKIGVAFALLAGIGFVVLSDGFPFREQSIPWGDANHQQAELLAATYALDSHTS